MIATTPQVQTAWLTSSPLWNEVEKLRALMYRPAILKFTTDTFLQDLIQTLAKDPKQLSRNVIRPAGDDAMKLYQPVHGHFHLVAANLVCALPGLPDRKVQSQSGEATFFVLRQIDSQGSEMARIVDGEGHYAWSGLDPDAAKSCIQGEVQFRMFPLQFQDNGQRRRMWNGLLDKVSTDGPEVIYVTRCVYTGPHCEQILSEPTDKFRFAAYDDPDAPQRPWVSKKPGGTPGLKSS